MVVPPDPICLAAPDADWQHCNLYHTAFGIHSSLPFHRSVSRLKFPSLDNTQTDPCSSSVWIYYHPRKKLEMIFLRNDTFSVLEHRSKIDHIKYFKRDENYFLWYNSLVTSVLFSFLKFFHTFWSDFHLSSLKTNKIQNVKYSCIFCFL